MYKILITLKLLEDVVKFLETNFGITHINLGISAYIICPVN